MKKNLLLLSSSRVGNTDYLEHALPLIDQFLIDSLQSANTVKELLFIPYAGISIGFDKYESLVKTAFETLEISVTSIHHAADKIKTLGESQAIIIGGGNTFCLLNSLYQFELIQPLQHAVAQGIPYIGWSAGSNIAGPTIRTTNDMPITEPPSFNALNLLPWQLNPHYIDGNPPGHNGETRQQRIEEFLISNPGKKVIGIPEGTALKMVAEKLSYLGKTDGFIFSKKGKQNFNEQSDLVDLLN